MTPTDRTIAAHGLPRHPKPQVLAAHSHQVANDIADHGTAAVRMATELAARGYPSGTLGDGGASSGASILVNGERVPVTSTEAAALAHDRFHDVDRLLATLFRTYWSTGVRIQQVMADVLAHASTEDRTPAGMGNCVACDTFCNPRKDPNDRLKTNLCPACYTDRARHKDISHTDWLVMRRQVKGHTEGAAGLAARFHDAIDNGDLGNAC